MLITFFHQFVLLHPLHSLLPVFCSLLLGGPMVFPSRKLDLPSFYGATPPIHTAAASLCCSGADLS